MHLWTRGRGIHGDSSPNGRVVGSRGRDGVRLLRRTRRIRSVEIRVMLGRWWITGRGVFPHINAPLRRVGQLPDIIYSVVRPRIRKLCFLSNQFTFRHKSTLRTAAVALGHHRSWWRVIRVLELVVLTLAGLVGVYHTDEVGPSRLSRSTRVRSANSISNFYITSNTKSSQRKRRFPEF